MLDRAVDRVDESRHGLGDCLADRRTEDREYRGGELARVTPDRLLDRALDGGRERDGELSVARGALDDRLRQLLRELVGRELLGVEAAAELVDLTTLRSEQQVAELGELANTDLPEVPGPAGAFGQRRAVVRHGQLRAGLGCGRDSPAS